MVMVFNIISALTDKLNEMEDQLKKDKMEAVIREHRKREEADKVKDLSLLSSCLVCIFLCSWSGVAWTCCPPFPSPKPIHIWSANVV